MDQILEEIKTAVDNGHFKLIDVTPAMIFKCYLPEGSDYEDAVELYDKVLDLMQTIVLIF